MKKNFDKIQYLRTIMPRLGYDPQDIDFAKHNLLNYKAAVYQPLEISSYNPDLVLKNVYRSTHCVLPKLEMPHFLSEVIQKVEMLRNQSEIEQESPPACKRVKKRASVLPREKGDGIVKLDGIQYNPEDYCFPKMVSSKPHRVSSPDPVKKKQFRRSSAPNLRPNNETGLALILQSKREPGRTKTERFKMIASNLRYQQDLTENLSSILSPLKSTSHSSEIFQLSRYHSRFSSTNMLFSNNKKFTGKIKQGQPNGFDPRHIPLQELKKMRKEVNTYDYFKAHEDFNEFIKMKQEAPKTQIRKSHKFKKIMEECVKATQTYSRKKQEICETTPTPVNRHHSEIQNTRKILAQMKREFY